VGTGSVRGDVGGPPRGSQARPLAPIARATEHLQVVCGR